MRINELNRLINQIFTIKTHIDLYEGDPELLESYEGHLRQLKLRHGQYLDELLFEIYDEHCEDSEIMDFAKYLSQDGVNVEAEDFPGVKASLTLRPNPLRFILSDTEQQHQEIIWKAA